jgi:hypothetical protein
MKTLMKLLMEHSYLKDQMAGMGHPALARESSGMPPSEESQVKVA